MDAWDLMPGTMKMFALFGLLVNVALIVAGVVVVIAIWRGMKAHEKLAESIAELAESTERIEKTIRSREKERL